MKIKWLDKPQKHDYPAAASYLSLTMDCRGKDSRRKTEKSRDDGIRGERHIPIIRPIIAWDQR